MFQIACRGLRNMTNESHAWHKGHALIFQSDSNSMILYNAGYMYEMIHRSSYNRHPATQSTHTCRTLRRPWGYSGIGFTVNLDVIHAPYHDKTKYLEYGTFLY